ncbi:hypothetical protein MRS76_16710 [Rhizobiaceae bacterium n13]|uniref:Uncharacterized protein n=1 Tax=Ferirhizobium litorale TaxID=2927786 RepID=A0AAE3QHB1_9HYPH|nr:hypothetical protein [Fererhizobium litorale]MDI7863599.1 hypothetical protein [Fererhizobium litorale]MDI7923480.1 hypothetical protein [Fererhizobium litorale]
MSGTSASFPDRETVASKLSALGQSDSSFLKLVFENPQQDDNLLEGVYLYLHQASEAKFLNSLKLEKCGEWIGANAPSRLQVRMMEVARSSQHPAYAAFRNGLARSGGLQKAYPQA